MPTFQTLVKGLGQKLKSLVHRALDWGAWDQVLAWSLLSVLGTRKKVEAGLKITAT